MEVPRRSCRFYEKKIAKHCLTSKHCRQRGWTPSTAAMFAYRLNHLLELRDQAWVHEKYGKKPEFSGDNALSGSTAWADED